MTMKTGFSQSHLLSPPYKDSRAGAAAVRRSALQAHQLKQDGDSMVLPSRTAPTSPCQSMLHAKLPTVIVLLPVTM